MKKRIVTMLVILALALPSAVFAGNNPFIVAVESHPNDDMRGYNLSMEVTDNLIDLFDSRSAVENPDLVNGKSPKHLKLAEALYQIRGICYVSFSDRYQVTVEKGKAFNWEKVEPEVTWVLKKYFQGKNMVIRRLQTPSTAGEIARGLKETSEGIWLKDTEIGWDPIESN